MIHIPITETIRQDCCLVCSSSLSTITAKDIAIQEYDFRYLKGYVCPGCEEKLERKH